VRINARIITTGGEDFSTVNDSVMFSVLLDRNMRFKSLKNEQKMISENNGKEN
jgi:hypothetical protein